MENALALADLSGTLKEKRQRPKDHGLSAATSN